MAAALVIAAQAFAADTTSVLADRPINGGLGFRFGQSPEPHLLGAEQLRPDFVSALDLPKLERVPSTPLPWRRINDLTLPRVLRNHPHRSYAMLNEAGQLMRVVTSVTHSDCANTMPWLAETLQKKYATHDAPWKASESGKVSVEEMHIEFSDRAIHVHCDSRTTQLDYADRGLIRAWLDKQRKRAQAYASELRQVEKRRVVLANRRALAFAESFTLGTAMRLEGAFGIRFKQPFAPRSKQSFPVDTPFIVGLPNLPTEFESGEIRLMLTPERKPITIRGRFQALPFERLAAALVAKYGSPLKSSDRHVIHKVSNDHVILRQLSTDTVELAFIDTLQQKNYKERLWQQESEGL